MSAPFDSARDAALALLTSEYRLTRKTGSFLGQLAVDPSPLSEKQFEWLRGLPPLNEGAGR